MLIDLKTVPFSRRGSSMAISWRPREGKQAGGLYLRALHGAPKWGDIFRISLHQGKKEIPFSITATPTQLRLTAKSGDAQFVFVTPSVLRFRASGVHVRLSMRPVRFDNAQPLDDETWMVSSFSASTKILLKAGPGTLQVDAPWQQLGCKSITADFGPDANGVIEGTLHEVANHVPSKARPPSLEKGLAEVNLEWEEWLSRTRGAGKTKSKGIELAAYVNWSSIVAPHGFLKRPTMLMSKNVMSNVWSWDHCFNAMAHCESHPALAWDQFMIFFDLQTASGAIPDCVGDQAAVWDFTKPPVHGWALGWMLARGLELTKTQRMAAYEALKLLTEWWFRDRDFNANGRPEYYHGNDSGWDNATIFKQGGPVESPDLLSFLVLQMETLSFLAAGLGRKKEAAGWQLKSETLLANLIRDFWREDRFIAYGPANKEINDSSSLFLYLPLVLGKRLPAGIRTILIQRLQKSGLITRHGLATESIRSPLYEADGYWRGPIWAPSTLLIVDGLRGMGEHRLAQSLSDKFRRLCEKSGFAENFDAQSGEGLRDRSYTWTASVFLILNRHYCPGVFPSRK